MVSAFPEVTSWANPRQGVGPQAGGHSRCGSPRDALQHRPHTGQPRSGPIVRFSRFSLYTAATLSRAASQSFPSAAVLPRPVGRGSPWSSIPNLCIFGNYLDCGIYLPSASLYEIKLCERPKGITCFEGLGAVIRSGSWEAHPPTAPKTFCNRSVVRATGFSRICFSCSAILRNNPSSALRVT